MTKQKSQVTYWQIDLTCPFQSFGQTFSGCTVDQRFDLTAQKYILILGFLWLNSAHSSVAALVSADSRLWSSSIVQNSGLVYGARISAKCLKDSLVLEITMLTYITG